MAEYIVAETVHPLGTGTQQEIIGELVRCKDCIFHGFCITSPKWAVAPKDDWYCADAERRNDDLQ